nr:MAG TPA: hypothetical protein [Herelleviridae sp.]
MGVEVKSGGEGVIVAAVTSRMANRKSSVLSRTLLKTRKLPVSTE